MTSNQPKIQAWSGIPISIEIFCKQTSPGNKNKQGKILKCKYANEFRHIDVSYATQTNGEAPQCAISNSFLSLA